MDRQRLLLIRPTNQLLPTGDSPRQQGWMVQTFQPLYYIYNDCSLLMNPRQLIAASDHAGFLLKQHLGGEAAKLGCSYLDLGPFDEKSVDYPDFVHLLAKALVERPHAMGVLICGSGNGVCMTANRYPHIRAALVWHPEIARLSRAHNNANVLCLPARFIEVELAIQCLFEFLHTPFEEGRHADRVAKINPLA